MIKNNVEYLYTKTQSLLPFDEGPSHGIKKNQSSDRSFYTKTCTEHLKVLNSVPEDLR